MAELLHKKMHNKALHLNFNVSLASQRQNEKPHDL